MIRLQNMKLRRRSLLDWKRLFLFAKRMCCPFGETQGDDSWARVKAHVL